MANAPEYAPADYSTLEAVQHYPELQSKKDVEISNGVHGKERFSTLESAPNTPDLNSKGNRYSTLEPYSPDHDHNEKPGAGLGLAPVVEASEEPKKNGSWKRKRVCGVPLLFLLIGVVVLLAVVAAVVGGVVGSRKKSNDPEPTAQQSGASTTSGSSATKTLVPGPIPQPTGSSLQATWISGDEKDTYELSSFDGDYLTDNDGDDVSLEPTRTEPFKKYGWIITPVSEENQSVYATSYPWGSQGVTQTYNIRPKGARSNLFLALQRDVAENQNAKGENVTGMPLQLLDTDSTDWNPSARAWFFRATDNSVYKDGGRIPWVIHSVAYDTSWVLSVDNSSDTNLLPHLEYESARWPGEQVWRLPKVDGEK